MTITWLGTASVRLETKGTVLLIDPFIQLPRGEHPNSAGTFAGAEYILITHGHLDHLASLPQLLERESPRVYCTACAVEHLPEGADVTVIHPGDRFAVGDVEVTVYQGRHIHFDTKLVCRTFTPANLMRAPGNILPLFRDNRRFQERGETVLYELLAEGRRVQVMGSLALAEKVDYPVGADVLMLPYQGSSYLPAVAESVLGRLRPKRIIVTHFDDAFPPASRHIDTAPLLRLAAARFPELAVTVPEYGKPIEF